MERNSGYQQSSLAENNAPRLDVVLEEKSRKKKYCSRCGKLIDSKTKKCTGCGKQYFRGIQMKPVTIILSLVIVASVLLNVFLYFENQKIAYRFSALYEENSKLKDSNIELRNERNSSDSLEKYFYRSHAEIIGSDNKVYHKYGCAELDRSGDVLIYNTEKAQELGYIECPDCH